MRKPIFITGTIILFYYSGLMAQDKNQTSGAKDTLQKQINLMDEHAQLFGKLFGAMEEDIDGTKNPFKNVKSYQDLLNQSNLDPKSKIQLLAIYKLYDQSLDPTQKDSLKVVLEKQFPESLNKPKKQH